MAAGTRLRGLPRHRPDGRAERQHAAPPVPEHRAGPRPGRHQQPHRQRRQPVRRTDPGRGLEQRDRAAAAAAAPVPAVPGHPDLALRRIVALPRPAKPPRAALLAGLYGTLRLHLFDVHRPQLHAELHRRGAVRGSGRRRRPAPLRLLGHPGTAVRTRPALGLQRERGGQRARRRLDGHGHRFDPERPADQLHRSRPQRLLQRRPERPVGQLLERRRRSRSSTFPASTSPTPRSRPTASSIRPGSATTSASAWPTTSATSRTASTACAARR